jgi:hypothetical protein
MRPYDFCNDAVRDGLFKGCETLFNDLRDLLLYRGGVFYVRSKGRGSGLTDARLWPILHYVAKRTLGFGKPMEWITCQDMLAPGSGISGSLRTIHYALSAMVEEGMLVRTHSDYGRVSLYALNIPAIFENLGQSFSCVKTQETERMAGLMARVKAHPAYSLLCSLLSSLNGKDGDFNYLKKELPAVDLEKVVSGPTKSSKMRKEMAVTNKALLSDYETLSKTQRQSRAVAAWENFLTRSPLYEEFNLSTDGKDRGMLGHFVEEMVAKDKSTKEIDATLLSVITRWSEIQGRWFSKPVKDGEKVLKTKAPAIPNFSIFFTFRHEIMAILDGVDYQKPSVKEEQCESHVEAIGGSKW